MKQTGSVRAVDFSRPWYAFSKELLIAKRADISQIGEKVLDIGCGVGEFMVFLQEMAFEVEGIDGSEEQMKIVHSQGLAGKVANLEEGLPYPDGIFSLATCLELIEHVARAEKLFKEINRILRPGGYFLLTTPNYSFLNNRFHYLKGMGPLQEGIHLRFFTKKRLRSLLQEARFEIVAQNSYGPIPVVATLAKTVLPRNPLLWRVPKAWESVLAYDFVYLARKI